MPNPERLPPASEVPSPCTGVCRIGQRGHCVGCGRDLHEIATWGGASDSERRTIRAHAQARLRRFADEQDA